MTNVQIPDLARNHQFAPGDFNCYDYYLKNTKKFGDYTAFSHQGKEHLKSEFVSDIEATAFYFKNKLGYKKGDVFTIFSPTNIESMILFMALNKIGVIVNFVHPLLPADLLDEMMTFTKSKGIMLVDMFVPKYTEVISSHNIPCIITVPATYAIENKYEAKASPETIKALEGKVKKYITYPEIINKNRNKTLGDIPGKKTDLAIYFAGGGTTGKSKIIKHTNSSLNELVYMLGGHNTPVEEIGIDTEICCMPFFHAYGFCAGGLFTMHKGAKAIFLPKFNADKFIEAINNNKVTEFNGVPNMFKKLLAHPGFDTPNLKNLRVMYAGGDDVRPSFVKSFEKVLRKNGSKASICAGWGLTECCAVCSSNPIWANKIGTIGKPMDGLRIEAWDENNHPVPQGTVGQLVINGPTMMEGYLTENGPKDEGIYYDNNGTPWILTGDLGYFDNEGYITFMGRSKRLIIISGYNVYPVDIEKLLAELPFINECCAVQGFDNEGKKIIRLFVVADNVKSNEEKYKKEILDLCNTRLEKFSVPRDIKFIDALPRTRLEKVDFLKLTEFEPSIK